MPAATRLRQLISGKEIVIAPGVYDGFSARIAQEVGFDCLYMVQHPHPTLLDPPTQALILTFEMNRQVQAPAPPSWASLTWASLH